MAKRVAKSSVLALLIALLLSACASSGDESAGSGSTTQSTGTVPGEKLSDEGTLAPGPPGSSASVRW